MARSAPNPGDPAPEPPPVGGCITDVLAVLASAYERDGKEGMEGLRNYVADALGDESNEDEIKEATQVAWEIIESVPLFIVHARHEAEEKGFTDIVDPLLSTAEAYYLHPVDLIPEMTQGLAGLLDDSYLVIRLLQQLCRPPEPLFDWDLEYPLRFLRRLMGPDIARELDRMAQSTLDQTSGFMTRYYWGRTHRA